MNKLEDYFNYEYLDELAEKEKIYYSPSVGWDKINSKKVNKNKLKLLKEINDKVLSGNYELVPYKVKLIIKNKDSKPRKTCIPAIKDRITISALKRYLYDIFDDETFNIPANKIIEDITKILKDKNKNYYIKIDMKSFFDNINHDLLLNIIKENVKDEKVLILLRKILENPQKCDETDKKIKNIIGVPQGISIATLLSNIYMHQFDMKYINNPEIDYFRYIDDIIIFADSSEKINEIFECVKYDLERKNLLLMNQEKTKKGNIEDGL